MGLRPLGRGAQSLPSQHPPPQLPFKTRCPQNSPAGLRQSPRAAKGPLNGLVSLWTGCWALLTTCQLGVYPFLPREMLILLTHSAAAPNKAKATFSVLRALFNFCRGTKDRLVNRGGGQEDGGQKCNPIQRRQRIQ